MADFDAVARIIEKLRADHDHVSIALDQPTLVPNEKGMRPVDRVARSMLVQLGGGIVPTNRSNPILGPKAPVWSFLGRIGAHQDPLITRNTRMGVEIIEVFPALALPALEPAIMKRGRAARYNPAKRTSFCLDDWRLVCNAVARHTETLGLRRLSRWARLAAGCKAPGKGDQDRLDAVICLVVALQWRRAPRDRVAVIGDVRQGYMVTPVSSEMKGILQRMAMKEAVSFLHPTRPQDTDLRLLLVETARSGALLTYNQVVEQLDHMKPGKPLFDALDRIAEENLCREEPLLPALVVGKNTKLPGPGFFKKFVPEAGKSTECRSHHDEHVAAIWKFDWPD